MNDRERRRYEMFNRVKTFGSANAADFAAGGEALKQFANVSQAITGLDDAKAGQQGGTTATAKSVLISALRLDLQNINRTASAIAQDKPGFADRFRLPAAPTDGAIVTTADAYIIELNKPGIAAQFIAHELPADFVQHLTDDRAAIDTAKDDMEGDREDNVASTATIGQLIKAGMKAVNYLDAIMYNKYARVPDKLRAWQSASHIERAPQREKTTPTPTPTPPSP
ncbi:MAG: hypothetical protein NTZ16_05155 [Verrucomicrobia bacterium]|nr:hypothetical protein [Verrucomicrobiota bacterium]